jgi:hypothetical protein
MVHEHLVDGLQGRAAALTELGRHAEAVVAWERMLTHAKGPERTAVLPRVAYDAAKAGDAGRALRVAQQVIAAGDAKANALYTCACGLAMVRDHPDAESCAAQAVELLRQAIAKGYQDFIQLRDDTDFAALRGRADFIALLWDAAETQPPVSVSTK